MRKAQEGLRMVGDAVIDLTAQMERERIATGIVLPSFVFWIFPITFPTPRGKHYCAIFES